MKKIIIAFAFLVFLSSCSKEDKRISAGDVTKSDTVTKSVTSADSLKTDIKEQNVPEEGLKDVEYKITDIPKDLKYTGKIKASAKWKDNNGENYIIITETDEKETPNKQYPGERFASKELYGYNYTINNGQSKLLWKIQDFEKDCEFDLTLEYIKNSLTITDLNNNGIAETSFLYILTCRSDVSPCGLKLLMHEGETKYAIRGTTIIRLPNVEPYGGEMTIDNSFYKAPSGFLDFAKKRWNTFKVEKIDTEED